MAGTASSHSNHEKAAMSEQRGEAAAERSRRPGEAPIKRECVAAACGAVCRTVQ